jgi:hypothetical protein
MIVRYLAVRHNGSQNSLKKKRGGVHEKQVGRYRLRNLVGLAVYQHVRTGRGTHSGFQLLL